MTITLATLVTRARAGSFSFIPAYGDEAGREFLAVYLFDKAGKLVEARIDDRGIRAALNRDQARRLLEEKIAAIGPVEYGRIQVQPFAIERCGTTFGLIPRPPEDEGDNWWVELQPGNYMAFHEPWDSGEYDTLGPRVRVLADYTFPLAYNP
jgi:hypothetical protein